MRKVIRIIVLAVVALLTVAVAASALLNSNRPTTSADPDALDAPQSARVVEFFHAHQALGDAVWPGWGATEIPVILYNEANVFLIGLPEPDDGWIKVPQNRPLGGPWHPTSQTIDGRPVYRQPLPPSGDIPEAFTVLVGERWVASLPTMEWLVISLSNQINDDLPPVVRPVFPYSLATSQLVSSSDHYISLIGHEAFHAHQGAVAPERLAAAERASARENAYPWDAAALEEAWQAELDLLAEAIAAPPEDAAGYARDFVRLRAERRAASELAPALAGYEMQREWLEGLALYAELGLWREASAAGYRPAAAIRDDPEFEAYAGYDRRLSRVIDQIGRVADDEGDSRFYYSGYAQAVLLDRLAPGWKARAFEPGVFLEDLLAEAVAHAPAAPVFR